MSPQGHWQRLLAPHDFGGQLDVELAALIGLSVHERGVRPAEQRLAAPHPQDSAGERLFARGGQPIREPDIRARQWLAGGVDNDSNQSLAARRHCGWSWLRQDEDEEVGKYHGERCTDERPSVSDST
jgi:hypothetical protein